MTPEEMDALVQELITEPMGPNETVRAYTIRKKKNGVVIVRQGIDPDPGEDEPRTQQCDTNLGKQWNDKGAEDSPGPEEIDQDELTKFGNDPPASEQAPDCDSQGY